MFRKKINTSKIFGLLLLVFALSTSCQRDDICPASTETTPLLNIAFFDTNDREIPKPAVNLRVYSREFDSIYLDRESVTVLSIPLRTDIGRTDFDFVLNAPLIDEDGEVINGNDSRTEVMSFIYTPSQIYVDRACGFIVNYLGLTISRVPVGDGWIDSTFIVEENIEVEQNIDNETEIHIRIYH